MADSDPATALSVSRLEHLGGDMPIDRSRYPTNWEELSLSIKTAANWHCQKCNRPCRKPGETWPKFWSRIVSDCWDGIALLPELRKPQRYTLTTAHIDQNPGNNEPENLRALCAPCHLAHDLPFRTANAQAKRERNGQLSLIQSASQLIAVNQNTTEDQ